jgi:AcrR family transcriptional regulator
MADRQDVLRAAIGLTLETGNPPSLADVARAVGLTKQGVLHYFPSRGALDDAVLRSALDRVDAEMGSAAREGRAAEAYLRLAAPSDQDRAAALVLVALLRRGDSTARPAVAQAIARWEGVMAEELRDPVRARVVRLVGDGLFTESLVSGEPPAAGMLDELVAHLVTGHGGAGR